MHSIVEKGGEGGKRFFFTSLLKSSIKLFMGEGKSISLSSLLDALPAHSKTFSFLPPENPPRASISQTPSETGTSWVQPGWGGALGPCPSAPTHSCLRAKPPWLLPPLVGEDTGEGMFLPCGDFSGKLKSFYSKSTKARP